ncbi:hypothetical protein VKT23_012735 [Stygiomarasmius scandens]|uniref:Uncharacterized protein n=1 Tax=Marasmiellus scandens TaxID=2682957 RepID=A0ABR1J7Q2_9AGAR
MLSESQTLGVRVSAWDAVEMWIHGEARSEGETVLGDFQTVLIQGALTEDDLGSAYFDITKPEYVTIFWNNIWQSPDDSLESLDDALKDCNGLKEPLELLKAQFVDQSVMAIGCFTALAKFDKLHAEIMKLNPVDKLLSILSEQGKEAPYNQVNVGVFVEHMARNREALEQMLKAKVITRLLDLHDKFIRDSPSGYVWRMCRTLASLDRQQATKKWLKNQDDTIRNRLERIRDGPYGWDSNEEPRGNEDEESS